MEDVRKYIQDKMYYKTQLVAYSVTVTFKIIRYNMDPWIQSGEKVFANLAKQHPGRKDEQEQEEISRNHVPRFFLGSVQ